MNCNVGRTEQIIRIVIGIVMVLIGVYYRSWWGTIGLIPILTGAIRYCPINKALGISTCDVKKKQ